VETLPRDLKVVLTSDQIQRRVRDIARQVSSQYVGKSLTVVCVLENGFMFMADLVRSLEVPVICQFIKPKYQQKSNNSPENITEILFSHDGDIKGHHVLVIEGLVHSGVTGEFLMSDLRARGAASVKLATLVDRQSARRVQLQPDYFGFLVDDAFLVGYGLGSPEQTQRNLPYLAVPNRSGGVT